MQRHETLSNLACEILRPMRNLRHMPTIQKQHRAFGKMRRPIIQRYATAGKIFVQQGIR